MTRLRAPLFSFRAQGRLASAIDYQDPPVGPVARSHAVPRDRRTLYQDYQRWRYSDYVRWWILLNPDEQLVWKGLASRAKMSGYNMWVQNRLSFLPDLIAEYRLDLDDGGAFHSSAPNAINLLNYGASVVPGHFGNAAELSGSPDYLGTANTAMLSYSGPLTVMAWFWADPGGLPVDAVVAMLRPDYPGGWAVNRPSTNDFLQFGWDAAGTWTYVRTGPIPLGGWHHVAATLDDAAMGRIYLDGNQANPAVAGAYPVPITPRFLVGGNTTIWGWGGKLDHVSYYSRALGALEVAAHAARFHRP